MKTDKFIQIFFCLIMIAFYENFCPVAYGTPYTENKTAELPWETLNTNAEIKREASVLDILFVLDNSGSMLKNDPNFITKDVVVNFVNGISKKSRPGIVLFDKTARLIEPLTFLPDAETKKRFFSSLEQVKFNGNFTNSPDGIERALYELKTNGRENADKIIIFLSDGVIDTGNRIEDYEKKRWLTEELALKSKKEGIRIFGIAFTENADFQLIQTLAIKTAGEYFRVFSIDDLPEAFKQIKQITADSTILKEPLNKTKSAEQVILQPDTSIISADETKIPVKEKGYNKTLIAAIAFVVIGIFFYIAAVILFKKKKIAKETFLENNSQVVLLDVENSIGENSLTLPIIKKNVKIGRDSENDIVIPQKTISSFHAKIKYWGDTFYLEDLRSANGTRLNGELLKPNKPAMLKSGDRIDFSVYEFRFLQSDLAPSGATVMMKIK